MFFKMQCLVTIISLTLCYAAASSDYVKEIMSHENWHLFDQYECGLIKASKITNGEPTKIANFPWLVQIIQSDSRRFWKNKDHRGSAGQYICGGALISEYFVITAAHCVYSNKKNNKFVIVGENLNLDGVTSENGQKIQIENIIIHKNYSDLTQANDIALIHLSTKAKYNPRVRPICLPKDSILEDPFYDQTVEIAGWGLDSKETVSQILKYVTLPIRDRSVCESIYGEIDETKWCIGDETGKDTCGGDSGSPVVWKRQEKSLERHYVIGVTSFGNEDCGEAPAIYTNVIRYVGWILDNVSKKDNSISSSLY